VPTGGVATDVLAPHQLGGVDLPEGGLDDASRDRDIHLATVLVRDQPEQGDVVICLPREVEGVHLGGVDDPHLHRGAVAEVDVGRLNAPSRIHGTGRLAPASLADIWPARNTVVHDAHADLSRVGSPVPDTVPHEGHGDPVRLPSHRLLVGGDEVGVVLDRVGHTAVEGLLSLGLLTLRLGGGRLLGLGCLETDEASLDLSDGLARALGLGTLLVRHLGEDRNFHLEPAVLAGELCLDGGATDLFARGNGLGEVDRGGVGLGEGEGQDEGREGQEGGLVDHLVFSWPSSARPHEGHVVGEFISHDL